MAELSRMIRTMGPNGQVITVVSLGDRESPADMLEGVDVSSMRVIFDRPLDGVEEARLGEVIEYWGALRYVTSDPVTMEVLKDRSVFVTVNTCSSKSHDIRRRAVIDELIGWICSGTPVRTTGRDAGTSAIRPLGANPLMVVVR